MAMMEASCCIFRCVDDTHPHVEEMRTCRLLSNLAERPLRGAYEK